LADLLVCFCACAVAGLLSVQESEEVTPCLTWDEQQQAYVKEIRPQPVSLLLGLDLQDLVKTKTKIRIQTFMETKPSYSSFIKSP
jgi:hypothetical protein